MMSLSLLIDRSGHIELAVNKLAEVRAINALTEVLMMRFLWREQHTYCELHGSIAC